MTNWKEKILGSDAARISPEAAERLIAEADEGESSPTLPTLPPLPAVPSASEG